MNNFFSTPLLTIAIPTFNRHKYLTELLPQLLSQTKEETKGVVEILVIDNASTDETSNLLISSVDNCLNYIRNSENIGADRNFLKCIQLARGEYVWLFGDDEILNPKGIQRILKYLELKPDLIVAESARQETEIFKSYIELLEKLTVSDPIFPVHQTLITRNIFKKEIFDMSFAKKMIHTNYAHLYGLISKLKKDCKIIVISKNESAFSVRDIRAEFADPPINLEKKLVELNRFIAKEINYPKLATDIYLYYNARSIYRLRRSKKFRKFLEFLGFR